MTDQLVDLTGWGRSGTARAAVRPVNDEKDIVAALRERPPRGVLPRGLGRSYGDVAQNSGGVVLDMTPLARIGALDAAAGRLAVDAGCSLGQIVESLLPLGWFLPVVPGTRYVTVGGAIACDIHGKNHHRDGGFGRFVSELTLLTPDGVPRAVTPSTPEFGATVGGLGLTGVVLGAVLDVVPVETAYVSTDVERARNLDDVLRRLSEGDDEYKYSVAWIDCAREGRGVLIRGNHALVGDLPARLRAAPLELPHRRRRGVPASVGSLPATVPSSAVMVFNELYYRRAREARGAIEPVDSFFWPLDAIANWNFAYGRGGFLQYQAVVPFGAEDALRSVITGVSAVRTPTLAVLKRLGEQSTPLSFPIPGWTIALDVPLPAPGLAQALDRADDLVAGAGGRVYFAKDSRLRREMVGAMYPRLPEWLAARAELDPDRVMQNDLARRLGFAHAGRR